MWDTIYTERVRQHAEENYVELRDEYFSRHLCATIMQLTNTRQSALAILDMGLWTSDGDINGDAFTTCRFRDLHECIECGLQQKKSILSELAHPEVRTNHELRALLEKNHVHAVNEENLHRFAEDFLHLGIPQPGLEDAHYCILKPLLKTYIPRTMSIRIYVLQCRLTPLVRHVQRRGGKWFKPNAELQSV
ncbi:hypothetical protein BJ165DRAFT_1567302 [Panaeolus papilionaceus]|nr:hypothetical protein BJ165DRAFT_1567302 [Panaeolus papilionaceus]